jgi:uncharacterized protein (DUF58 family)
MPMLRTSRGTVILLLSAVFVTFGLLQLSNSSLALVYTGVGLFLFYYVSRLILQIKIAALNKMQIVRNRPVSISEDKTVPVNLEMTNTTFMGVQVEVFDSYPPFFRLKKGTNTAIVTVPGRGYTQLSYELQPTSIGDHEFGPMHLVMRDIAGLFFYQRDIDVHGSLEVTPRVRELARGSLAANAFSSYSGPIVSRRKGEGMEFADIREYTHGDPFKRIEWKSSARTGELMVRELHAETTLNVMIILDASDTMSYGQAGQTKLDYSARAVASLVNYLSKRGDFFGLTVVQGERPATVIPLARGQVQITRILSRLGQLQPTPASPQLLAQAIARSLKLARVKGRTLFFILSDLETKEELSSLRQLRAMSHEAVIISPYSPLFESHDLQGLDKTIFAIRTAHSWHVREQLMLEAGRLGVPFFDVGPGDLFSSLVQRVEEHRRSGGS